MNVFRVCFRMTFVFAGLAASEAIADGLPTYQELNPSTHSARKFREEPRMLSRFPTTFSMAYLADENRLRSVDIDGRVWEWGLSESHGPSRIAETHSEPACALFSDDGRLLAFANPDGQVSLMDLDAKQTKLLPSTPGQRTVSLCFSRDSSLLAGANTEGQIHVWDVGSRQTVCSFGVEPSPMQTLAFSPDGRHLAMASFSSVVKLHFIPKDETHKSDEPRLLETGSRVTEFAFTPNGEHLVIAGADGTTRVYDLGNDAKPVLLETHPFASWSIAFDPSGQRMATGSWDGTIKLWDATTWERLQAVKKHEESVAALVFGPGRQLISAGLDGRLFHWQPDIPTATASGMITGRPDSVWVATYSPDGNKLFVGGREKRFELWNLETKELLVSREGHPTTRCAVFSPDGTTLATGGDDGKIFLCDALSGDTHTTLLRHRGAVSAVLFTDQGQTLISVCDGGFVKVWDTATGENKFTWKEHRHQIYCANVSPDGKWLVTGGGDWTTGDPGELIVWDLKAGRPHANIKGHTLAVWSAVFMPGGERFASSDSSGAVKIWNLQTLQEERTLQHSTWVRTLALAPDGDTLAVGRGDGSVRLWDTATWSQRAACEGHGSFAFWLQYAPSGKTLASGGNDGTVRFWHTER